MHRMKRYEKNSSEDERMSVGQGRRLAREAPRNERTDGWAGGRADGWEGIRCERAKEAREPDRTMEKESRMEERQTDGQSSD